MEDSISKILRGGSISSALKASFLSSTDDLPLPEPQVVSIADSQPDIKPASSIALNPISSIEKAIVAPPAPVDDIGLSPDCIADTEPRLQPPPSIAPVPIRNIGPTNSVPPPPTLHIGPTARELDIEPILSIAPTPARNIAPTRNIGPTDDKFVPIAPKPHSPIAKIASIAPTAQKNIGPSSRNIGAKNISSVAPSPSSSEGARPPSPPPPRTRKPRELPAQHNLKHSLAQGFHFKGELPLDVIKSIIGASDLIVTMLFAMTCKSFQESVVWNSITCIDTRIPLPFPEEDTPALHRALYRRHEKLTSVDTFIMSGYPDLEVSHLLLESMSSNLKTLMISGSYSSRDLREVIPKCLNPDVIEWIDADFELKLRPINKKVYSKLKHLEANSKFSDIPQLVKLCPALEFLSATGTPVPKNTPSFSDQWNSAISLLQTLRNFRTLSLSGSDSGLYQLLNNPDQKTFNHSVLNFIEKEMKIATLPVVRFGYYRDSVAQWLLQHEFHEPSQGEYWTLFKWCHGHESNEELQERFEGILTSLIVPKRRALARKSLGIFLDQFATYVVSDDYTPGMKSTVLLVTALDSAGLLDRAKFWFDKLGRSEYEKAKAAGQSLSKFCLGENISWAGFLVQGMKAEDWCRKSGFLDDLLHLMKDTSSVRQNHYNIRPGFFALMMNYPELEEYLCECIGKSNANGHSGYMGRIVAEYDVATDIPTLPQNISKIVKMLRIMYAAGNDYHYRIRQISTEEHKWDLGLFGYWPNETPEFQEARVLLAKICSSALQYMSTKNATTWLEAPDEVSLSQLTEIVSANTSTNGSNYRELGYFTNAVWVAVFDLVSKGRDPVRIVKRALQFGSPPTNLTDPATYHMKSIDLVALNNRPSGIIPGGFSVYDPDTVAKVQRGLHANIPK